MTALLQLDHLSARYGKTAVLHDMSFSVQTGQITTLLGANGAGKTSTLRAICQMMLRTQGRIQFLGQDVTKLKTEKIVALGIGHVPDGRGTFLGLSTEENLKLGAYLQKNKIQVEEDMERVYGYFPRLKQRYKQQAGTLSGGEQQMLAIGRALMGRPKLLLLDEPSFGIAPLVVRDIFEILKRINSEEEVSILLVEQNANLALAVSDYAVLIETGRIMMAGSAKDIKNDPMVQKIYLGH